MSVTDLRFPAEDAARDHGHASITTTLDLYGHLYPGEMDCYVARLDDAAGQVSAGQADAAKMRPDDTDTDPEDSTC